MATRFKKFFDRFRPNPAPAKQHELTRDQVTYIADCLGRLMDEEKPYLRFGYSLRDLAHDTHIPSHQLSAFLNGEAGLNFNTFLNHYRVWHCEELIQKGIAGNEKLEILALQCGFGNRNSLTVAFKKFTGFTPSRYLKGWQRLLNFEGID